MGILVSMIAILILIAPIIVVAMIVSAIVKKKNNETNKSFFEDTIRAIYVYIVLICALCAIIGGVISTFNYGLDVFLPEEEYEETELSKERERRTCGYSGDPFTEDIEFYRYCTAGGA